MVEHTEFVSEDTYTKELMDDQLSEFDEDVKPMIYAHMIVKQIIRAPHIAFINGQTNAGMMSLVVGVDQLEKVLMADEKLKKEDYEKDVKEAIEKADIKDNDNLLKNIKISNIKFQILLSKLFKSKMRKVELEL